ncbi:MAG: RNA 2',3'-cyclic phosphodiesterase [Magnetococcales bacterium]|nr:RNA 2',3'-cyclic phosphodiesterase [Magnetococcales bacterium]
MRLFLALDPTPEVATFLDGERAWLQTQRTALVWIPKENYHLTLRFLGELNESDLPALQAGMARATTGVAPFTLQIAGWGGFPSMERGRIFWVGVAGTALPSLHTLVAAIHREITAGEQDDRPFHPHITLARARKPGWSSGTTLPTRATTSPPWPITALHLYRSQLGSGPPRYQLLHSEPLVGQSGRAQEAAHGCRNGA